MENKDNSFTTGLFESIIGYIRRFLFRILSLGPIPKHIAFILDGNRRYGKKLKLPEGKGHRAGYNSLMSILKYCYELQVKYVTIYAFSIENFKRRPEEVESVMDLMLEKIESLLEKESIVDRYGIRVYFVGNLSLLTEPVRLAAERAMKATAKNSNSTLVICVAYTSTDEIVHAVEECCKEKWDEIESTVVNDDEIKLLDIERKMYMEVVPEPDILVRTSNETRLSNFLLWQTSNCLLYSPKALWPEIGLRHLLWGILNFQRTHSYLEKTRKQL